jgi:hypothetical protein
MGLSADDKLLVERIENDFTYHPPDGKKAEMYQHLRLTAKDLARQIVELCPASRERSLALTQLEECVMWANAGIARHEVE